MSETRVGQERFVAPIDETPLRAIDAVNVDAVPENQWKEAWKRLRTSVLFWLAVLILAVIAAMIFLPGLFTDVAPNTTPKLADSFGPPRNGHPFGFTRQGGDVWARTVYGARASVAVGVLTTILTTILGMITGAIAGFYGGIADSLLSRFSDIFFSIPLLLACIVVISVLNNTFPDRGFWGSVFVVVLALSLFAWPQITRQMRGAVLEIKNLEFVDAATAIGASKMKNLRRHIVPNALAPVIVTATISLGVFIVAEASLSFLGLGLPQNVASWGNDLSDAQAQVRSGQHLNVMYVPAAALALTVLGFILLGEAVREALDPEGEEEVIDNAPLLEVENLSVGFRAGKEILTAVDEANLTIYPGQTIAIVGESGSGKSTLAHAVIGLLPGTGKITGGSIKFEGTDVSHAGKGQIIALRGSSIGLVPQDPMSNLNPLWRVGSQIKEALVANGVATGAAADKRVVELLEEAGLPDAERRARQYPHEFSGGMRQRALIAMGLAARPKLLIADEPTSALDVTVQKQILDHLDKLTDDLGVAVMLITHDLGLAAERADHLVVMYRGRVVESGPARSILQDPEHPYTKRLVSKAPSLASQRLSSLSARAEVRKQAVQTAAQIAEEIAESDTEFGEGESDIIVVENLTKIFSLRGAKPWQKIPFAAVDDVSFKLKRGTTTAIVGESGSGKSTVARMVLDLLPPTSGDVLFDGHNLRELKTKHERLRLRRQMQPVFQNPYASLDPLYSIYKSIEEPLRTHDVGTNKEREARVRDLLDRVSLPTTVMSRYPGELSGGQRQRVAIARALALEPEVVICDEAVSALDVLVQAQILELLNDLQAELGLSYLFITHDLAVVRQIADNVLVMQDGKVVEAATVSEVFDNPREAYTRKLLDAIPGASIELGR